MKFYRTLVEWLKSKIQRTADDEYKLVRMRDFPEQPKLGEIYLISDSQMADTIILSCPCNCGATIYLNLLTDTRPVWKYKFSSGRKISVSPSVWRTTGCKSHFFIRDGKIAWVRD